MIGKTITLDNMSKISSLEEAARIVGVPGNSFVLLSGSRGKGIGSSESDWDIVVIRMEREDSWTTQSSDVLKWLSSRGWMKPGAENHMVKAAEDPVGGRRRGGLAFKFDVPHPQVQTWTTDYPSFRVLTCDHYVPFLVEAVRLANKDPLHNIYFMESSFSPLAKEIVDQARNALLSGREWFQQGEDGMIWQAASDSFSHVTRRHMTKASDASGQPLCRKLALHTLSFVDTADWLMGHDGRCFKEVPNSFCWDDLNMQVVAAVEGMLQRFLQKQPPAGPWGGRKKAPRPVDAKSTPPEEKPNVAITLANNRTLTVALPLLDAILRETMAGIPDAQHVYALLQTSRLVRSKTEVLLREKLMRIGFETFDQGYNRSKWALKVLSEFSLAQCLLFWARLSTLLRERPSPRCWQCGAVKGIREFTQSYVWSSSFVRSEFRRLDDVLYVHRCSCQYDSSNYSSGSTFYAIVQPSARDRWLRHVGSTDCVVYGPDTPVPSACFYCEKASLNPGKIQKVRTQLSSSALLFCENFHIWGHEEVQMDTLKWRYVYATQPTWTLPYAERARLKRAATPCRAWARGTCAGPPQCDYKHEGAPGVAKPKVCFQWAEKGVCPRKKCKFLHEQKKK